MSPDFPGIPNRNVVAMEHNTKFLKKVEIALFIVGFLIGISIFIYFAKFFTVIDQFSSFVDAIIFIVFEFILLIAVVFSLWQIFLSCFEVRNTYNQGEGLFIEYFHLGKKYIPRYKNDTKIFKVKKRQLFERGGAFRPMRLICFKRRQFALLTIDQARKIFG